MGGSIEPYETAKGKRYRVRYRKPGGASTDKRGFTTQRDARLFLASVTMSKARGEYVDPSLARETVGMLAVPWLAKKRATGKPTAFRDIEITWRVRVEPRWTDVPVGEITPGDVEAWIAEVKAGTAVTSRRPTTAGESPFAGKPVSGSTTLKAVGVLAGILDDAVRDRRIARNPARFTDALPKKVTTKPRRYLTDAEVMQLAEAINDPTRSTLIVLLAYTGLRWSEAAGLRVRDINMLRRRVHVNRAVTQAAGKFHIGEPKSWEKRSVAFPAFLELALAALCEGKTRDGVVFEHKRGGYIRQTHSTHSWFLTALDEIGVERMTPHDLRHTAASLAVSSGANVKVVQRMLGHKSAAMTLDTYADLFDEDLDDVAGRLNLRAIETGAVGKLWANLGMSA